MSAIVEDKAKPWYDPAELARLADNNKGNLAASGDFGSYAIANATGQLENTGIESHNLVYAEARVRLYRQLWRGRRLGSIADMGCGLGLTTAALADQCRGAAVVGYDVSADAVEYGRARFPQATFEQRAIAEDVDLGRKFDLILCQEFYPFTRTADWALQSGILAALKRHLAPGGVVVVELSEREAEKSILVNLDKISDFSITRTRMPYDRVFRNLPFVGLAQIASFFLALATRVPRNVHLVLTPAKAP